VGIRSKQSCGHGHDDRIQDTHPVNAGGLSSGCQYRELGETTAFRAYCTLSLVGHPSTRDDKVLYPPPLTSSFPHLTLLLSLYMHSYVLF
jgi:hypothetical protein